MAAKRVSAAIKKSGSAKKSSVKSAAKSISKSTKAAATKSAKKSSQKKPSALVTGKPSAFLQINKDIWPLEADVLFRPDRMRYVRKLVKPEGCVFCTAATAEPSFETLCVYRTETSMIILNKFPYNSGHVLVLPRRHCGDLLKLSEIEFTDLQNTIRLAMKALQDVYQPGGINLGLNHGAVAGAGMPEHLHYHLIPRWSGDLNFFPLIAQTKVLVETLEQTYERLLEYFKKL